MHLELENGNKLDAGKKKLKDEVCFFVVMPFVSAYSWTTMTSQSGVCKQGSAETGFLTEFQLHKA